MDRSRLAVVIPCHNEAASLGPVVSAALQHGRVIVVDDRSDDGSPDLARGLGAEVLSAAAPGYDGAIATGLRHAHDAGHAFIVTLDADGEHDPAHLSAFAQAFESGAELVCGIRPRPQRLAEWVAAEVSRALFGVRDPLCGMKGCSRQVVGRWLASGEPLLVNMAPAFLWLKSGGRAAEVRIDGVPRQGRPRFGRALRANLAILRAFVAALGLEGSPRQAPAPA